jgi:hypothetical protein
LTHPNEHRISKSELFSVANDKDAIPAKSETTDYISSKAILVHRELAATQIELRFTMMLQGGERGFNGLTQFFEKVISVNRNGGEGRFPKQVAGRGGSASQR